MLKITEDIDDASGGTRLRLDGQIAGEWVAELRRVYSGRDHGMARMTTIDLAGVGFIDNAGLAFLGEIYSDVTFINCSLFAAEQLKAVSGRQERFDDE